MPPMPPMPEPMRTPVAFCSSAVCGFHAASCSAWVAAVIA